jgi:hypothetical protein
MSMWSDDLDVDGEGLYGDEEAEDFGDLEDFGQEAEDLDWESDGEDIEALTPAQRRRRARLRQARVARYRRLRRLRAARARARTRGGRPRSPRAVIASTRDAVEKVDLENKVQADATATALAAQSRRADGSENAAIASALVSPLQETIETFSPDLGNNPILKKGLPLAPLLLLRPRRKGRGFEAFASDKRVWAVGAVVGLSIAQGRRGDSRIASLALSPSDPTVPAGRRLQLSVIARDRNGNLIANPQITWGVGAGDPGNVVNGVLTLDSKAKAGDLIEVTADAEGVQQAFVQVRVT